MESKPRSFRHPIHSMLSVLPVGLFISVVIFDTFFLVMRNPILSVFSFTAISAGVLGGTLAVILSIIEGSRLPAYTRARMVGISHAFGNVLLVALFGCSWWFRAQNDSFAPSGLALILSYAAIWIVPMTVLWGEELIYYLDGGRRASGISATRPFLAGRASDFIKTLPLFNLQNKLNKKA